MIKIFFIFFNLILFIPSYSYYSGSFFILFYFCISCNLYVLYSFRKKYIFTEIFLSLLLWLGFYFKFIIVNLKLGFLKEGAGFFDYTALSYDKALLVLSYGFSILILLSYARERFFSYEFFFNNEFKKKKKLIDFYFRHEFFIIIFFISIVLIFSILNMNFSIYQKGILPNQNVSQLFSSLFKWLTLFGFASISSFIIYCYLQKKKNLFLAVLVSIVESAITSHGLLSRASFIFTQLSLAFGIKKYWNLSGRSFSKIKLSAYTILIVSIFFISIFFVTQKRETLLYGHDSSVEKNKINKIANNRTASILSNLKNKNFREILNSFSSSNSLSQQVVYLSLNRWVGLDSFFAVSSFPDKGKELFFEALKEKPNNKMYTFYQRIFLGLTTPYESYNLNKNYGIVVPGFFSFAYYSGSILFFLILVSFFYIFGVLVEYLSFRFSMGNIIFSSLISQAYVWRIIHFGYLPSNTYLYIAAIILNIFLYYFFILLINNKNK